MEKCFVCNCKLTEKNIARWDIPETEKHMTVRKDSKDNEWCQNCTDMHDSIDFDSIR